jgi:ribonuclease D
VPADEKNNSFTFISSPAGVEEFVRSLNDSRSIALDTEGASFHRYVDRVYLIQLSVRHGSAIIDPLAMGTPPGLGDVLENPDVEVVLHDADYDLRLLHQDYGWSVRRVFDTRVAAQLLGIRSFGLGALLQRFFGVVLDKKHQRADWSMRPLTPAMLEYAALDTSYLLDLRDELARALDQLGRTSWAEEEFKRIEGTKWEPETADEAFLRIKGARDLTRPQLSVLREIARWRDKIASELDRAVFRVIGNEPLLAIAQSTATSLDELTKIKGVPRGIAEKRGDELLSAIERGRGTPPDKMPRFPRPKRFEKDSGFEERVARLRAARESAAQRLELDPGVLCSRERLEAIARRGPVTLAELAEVDGLRQWQVGELGEDFLRALSRK